MSVKVRSRRLGGRQSVVVGVCFVLLTLLATGGCRQKKAPEPATKAATSAVQTVSTAERRAMRG
jgi:hypothetical protein